jgi:hypothetical protein
MWEDRMAQKKQAPPVQYRPGPMLGRWLADLAAKWRVPENEVARRLAALAACQLDITYHPMLNQLAGALATMGTPGDFVLGCDHIRTAIESSNRTRKDLEKPPLAETEVVTFVKRILNEAVRARQARMGTVEQEQTVKVYRT